MLGELLVDLHAPLNTLCRRLSRRGISKQETSHCAFTKSEVHLIAFKSERDATIIKVFVVAKKNPKIAHGNRSNRNDRASRSEG